MQATLKILRKTSPLFGLINRTYSQLTASPLLVANPIFNSMPEFLKSSSYTDTNKNQENYKISSNQFDEINNTLLKADLGNLAEFRMIGTSEIKECISNILTQQTTNYTPEELKKISAGLCRQYATTLLESEGTLDMSVLKNLFYMTKVSNLSPVELFYAINKILRSPSSAKQMTIEEITSLTYLIHELFRTQRLKRSSSSEKEKLTFILNKLQYNLESLLDENMINETDKLYFLPKILFCNVILGNQDAAFLSKVIGRIFSCDFTKLTENELLSMYYIAISIEKKIRTNPTQGKLQENHAGLLNRVDTMIAFSLQDGTLSLSNIPFLLFCYSLVSRPSNKIVYTVMKKVIDNINKFKADEMSTILYAMFRMPEIDPNNDILALILSMFYTKENLQQLNGMNMFATLLGLRKPYQETTNPKHRELFKSLILRIQKQFEENFENIERECKLRIIYEFVHIHKIVSKENYLKYYRKYVESIDPSKINTQDLLTIGSIQKKFLMFDQESYEFWENYLKHLTKARFDADSEVKRASVIVRHLMSILDFDMLVNEKGILDSKVRTQWYEMVHSYYKKISTSN